jgi:putative transposase
MVREIVAGNIYHILSRGVDRRKIFLEDEDYFRFIHDLFEFNDTAQINNVTYFFRNRNNFKVIARPYIYDRRPRKLLVEILIFTLMPNHYHLLLRPRFDNGVTKFMKRLNMGYARYFNEKYKRSGALFEGRYKSVSVKNEAHFIYLPYYVHVNPLDLKFPEWRNKEIKNYKEVMRFLESYKWSSFPDYIGKKNFPSVTQREFLLDFFGGLEQYKKDTLKWLKEMDLEEIKDGIKDLTLE